MSGADDSPSGPRAHDDAELPASATGSELLRASLDSLRQFAASQEAMTRSLERQRVNSWWRTGLLGLAVVGIVVFLAWAGWQLQHQSRTLVQSLERAPVASSSPSEREQALEEELSQLRQRLADLENARVADLTHASQPARPAPESHTPQGPGTPAVDSTKEKPDAPWTGVTSWEPESPSGRPNTEPSDPATQDLDDWKEGLLRGMERGASIRPELAEAEAAESAEVGSTEPEEPAGPTAEELAQARRALAVAVNQLLQDAGMKWLTFVEGTADPETRTITDVTMTSAGSAGREAGTIHAGRMRLIRDPISAEARLVCDEAHSTQDGIRVEYPGRQLVLEVPGRLPMQWIREPLAALVQEPGPGEIDDSPQGLTDTYNRILEKVEEVPVRFLSIERRSAGDLLNLVVEWETGAPTPEVRELRIDRAWWELDETRASLTLICEGGSLKVGEVRRPFFRGQYRLPLRNVNVDAWRALPCVRRVTAGSRGPADAPGG